MGDRSVMHVGKGFNSISEILYCLFGLQHILFSHVIEQCPSTHILQHQINIILMLEETIKLHNVGVIQGTM